jgi:hypothetical protein
VTELAAGILQGPSTLCIIYTHRFQDRDNTIATTRTRDIFGVDSYGFISVCLFPEIQYYTTDVLLLGHRSIP